MQNPLFGIILVLIVRSQRAKVGVSAPSRSGDNEQKSKIITDFFLSPFHSLISDLKIFPNAELTPNHAQCGYFSTLNAAVGLPSLYLAPAG